MLQNLKQRNVWQIYKISVAFLFKDSLLIWFQRNELCIVTGRNRVCGPHLKMHGSGNKLKAAAPNLLNAKLKITQYSSFNSSLIGRTASFSLRFISTPNWKSMKLQKSAECVFLQYQPCGNHFLLIFVVALSLEIFAYMFLKLFNKMN